MARKSKAQILDEMLADMKANTPITQTAPGGIARSILEIVNERLDDTYDYVDAGINSAFLSTASGNSLDKIGELVSCTRLANETDTNYRYRISQQVLVAAKSNETALRLKCLEVTGVVDVILTPYTHGVGSFTAHVISNDLDTSDTLVTAVQSVINTNQAAGVRGIAAKPKLIPVDVVIRLVAAPGVTTQEANSISYSVQSTVDAYIKRLGMGKPIESIAIYQIANQPRVAEASIEVIRINDRVISGSPAEYACKWDERFYPREIRIVT